MKKTKKLGKKDLMRLKSDDRIVFTCDHSGDPIGGDFPVGIGVVRVDPVENKRLHDSFYDYLKKRGPHWNKKEVKWTRLQKPERFWLANEIDKSKMEYSGAYITGGEKQNWSDFCIANRIKDWEYKLLAGWYLGALIKILPKDRPVLLKIHRFKFSPKTNKPTRKMLVFLNHLEKSLQIKHFDITIKTFPSSCDKGIQTSDWVAGLVRNRNVLKNKYSHFKFPKNVSLTINPRIKPKDFKLLGLTNIKNLFIGAGQATFSHVPAAPINTDLRLKLFKSFLFTSLLISPQF